MGIWNIKDIEKEDVREMQPVSGYKRQWAISNTYLVSAWTDMIWGKKARHAGHMMRGPWINDPGMTGQKATRWDKNIRTCRDDTIKRKLCYKWRPNTNHMPNHHVMYYSQTQQESKSSQ